MSTPVLVTACYDAATMLDGKGSLFGVKIAPTVEFAFGVLGYDVKCDTESECTDDDITDCTDDSMDDCYDDECDDDCDDNEYEPEAD